MAKFPNKILVFIKRRNESHQFMYIFFSFKKDYSNCFTNHWILSFIPQFFLLFYVWGTMGLSLELCSLQPCWRPGPCTRPSDRSFTLWQPQSTRPVTSTFFSCRSYPSRKVVASTELKRLRPTGRCGATRGERNKKLWKFSLQNYPRKVITFKTFSPLCSVSESWFNSFKTIEGTQHRLIFRHCDFPWAPKN